jgi:pyrroloquinoline quinone (PQQ) biosynthesis protein C
MATVLKSRALVKDLGRQLVRMANAQFDSEPFKRLLALPLNKKRAQIYTIQRTHWTVNRRDCWAAVQASAPFAVKKLIWDHERDELEGDKQKGKADHYQMSVQEGATLGLKAIDFQRTGPTDGCLACCNAWENLARTRPWLGALASSAALELSNSDQVLKGGSMSRRMGMKIAKDVGIPFKKQTSNAEHAVADIAHGHMMMEVAEVYVTNTYERDLVLQGAADSWSIDRVWKGHLADIMAAIPL